MLTAQTRPAKRRPIAAPATDAVLGGRITLGGVVFIADNAPCADDDVTTDAPNKQEARS